MNSKYPNRIVIILGITIGLSVVGNVILFTRLHDSSSVGVIPPPTSHITVPTTAPQALPITPRELATWKTYTDQAVGYTIKYPPNWHATVVSNNSGEKSVHFGENGKKYINGEFIEDYAISIAEFQGEASSVSWGKFNIDEATRGGGDVESVSISTIKATRVGNQIFFVHNKKGFIITKVNSLHHYPELESILPVIVSTLTFSDT